jgi:hypothetical protein
LRTPEHRKRKEPGSASKEKGLRVQAFFFAACARSATRLLQLRLFVDDVLANDRIKFFELNLVGLRPFVFGRCIEVAGSGTGFKLDLFAHVATPYTRAGTLTAP